MHSIEISIGRTKLFDLLCSQMEKFIIDLPCIRFFYADVITDDLSCVQYIGYYCAHSCGMTLCSAWCFTSYAMQGMKCNVFLCVILMVFIGMKACCI